MGGCDTSSYKFKVGDRLQVIGGSTHRGRESMVVERTISGFSKMPIYKLLGLFNGRPSMNVLWWFDEEDLILTKALEPGFFD